MPYDSNIKSCQTSDVSNSSMVSESECLSLLNSFYQQNVHQIEHLSKLTEEAPASLSEQINQYIGILGAATENIHSVISVFNTDSKDSESDHMSPFEQEHPFIEAEHSSKHQHAHFHDPKEQQRRISRLSRIIGHLQYVKKLMESNADCSAVLIQISAVKSALDGLGKSIIKDHLSHCIIHAIESGDSEAVQAFQKAIDKYL